MDKTPHNSPTSQMAQAICVQQSYLYSVLQVNKTLCQYVCMCVCVCVGAGGGCNPPSPTSGGATSYMSRPPPLLPEALLNIQCGVNNSSCAVALQRGVLQRAAPGRRAASQSSRLRRCAAAAPHCRPPADLTAPTNRRASASTGARPPLAQPRREEGARSDTAPAGEQAAGRGPGGLPV